MPVAIDGMVIEPGDLILGDGDGILCVPYDATTAVLAAANEKVEGGDARDRRGGQGRARSRLGRRTPASARLRDVKTNEQEDV